MFGAFVLVLLLGAMSSLAVVTVRSSFPTVDGDVALPGLRGRVEVLRDGYGVPQLYADTPEDLFFAQGYVHAQDRFWEMDFRRHVTSGRLSELFGESQLGTDLFLRTLGWHDIAQQEPEEKHAQAHLGVHERPHPVDRLGRRSGRRRGRRGLKHGVKANRQVAEMNG